MAAVVSLKDVVDALDLPNDEWVSYINPMTGEIVTVSGEEREMVEDERLDEETLPEWQRESLAKSREALESGDFLELPGKFDIHEWAIMDRFARGQTNPARASELHDAIRGPGPFRTFRSVILQLRIEEDWYRFRQAAFEEIARQFLTAHEIRFE
jgi:hypothetical protein